MTARWPASGVGAGPPAGFLALLVSLYFAQGLPSGFFAHALPALLREAGVSFTLISLAKLLALPWFLKCCWAQWVDRYGSERLGHYRGWILLLQSACVLPLGLLAWLGPTELFTGHLGLFILIALLINTCMATQDVATDALAVRGLPLSWRGLGNSLQVAGYKLGMLAGGNGLLWLIALAGWAAGFHAVAALLALLLLPVWFYREPPRPPAAAGSVPGEGGLAFWREWQALFARPALHGWLPVLLTYKLADALGSTLIKPMLVDAGYTLAVVGQIGLVSSAAGMLAAVLGGFVCHWVGIWRTLFYGGILQALGLGLYALVAAGDGSLAMVYAISVFEQAADAMSTVALFAAMMGYCRHGHEGGDYTVQMALFMVLSGTVSLAAGAMADAMGLPAFFVLVAGIGLACVAWVPRAARAAPVAGQP